ncbi:MAG TPA: AIR synthase-related protein, partial [Abditibacteriaceae bacterium]|nr:AIR synthase-related protein [Abditibacteriaceae bacterium]
CDLMINVALVGDARVPLLRSGARAGDAVLVSGPLGDAAAGLAVLQNPAAKISDAARAFLLQRHHDPIARLREIRAALAAVSEPAAIHAAIDISDGLLGDAGHVAEASSLSIEIELARLPVTEHCRETARAMNCDVADWVLRGGEDYEVLLCVAPAAAPALIEAVSAATGTLVTAIGRCVPRGGEAVALIQTDGRRVVAPAIGFTHF